MDFTTALMTIREINEKAVELGLPKHYRSYTCLYNIVRSGRVPVTKLGNRYLLRICDIEKFLSGQAAPVAGGIRRID